jgi:hypothetical protein
LHLATGGAGEFVEHDKSLGKLLFGEPGGTQPAAVAHALTGRASLAGFPASSEKPVRTSSSNMTSPNWRMAPGEAGPSRSIR